MNDRLAWWEEIPLGLALLAQSYVVGLWYYASIDGADWWVDLAIAVGAGLALDLIVVTTVMGRRAGRSSGWSWATSLGAFGCSALIALDRYGWEWRSGLHIAFPLVVFLYSQHLATPRKQPLEALQERSRSSKSTEVGEDTAAAQSATGQALLDQLLELPLGALEPTASNMSAPLATAQVEQAPPSDGPSTPLEPIALSAYRCDYCQAPLKNKQAVGAMRTNGYCRSCKAERLAAA